MEKEFLSLSLQVREQNNDHMRSPSPSQSRLFPNQATSGQKKIFLSRTANVFGMPWLKIQNSRPTTVALLVTLFTYSFLQSGLHNGVTPATLTSIQRRYGLGATASGFFVVCYDLGVVLAVSWVCYLARQKKGAWLGGGHAVMAAGSVIYALPQFLSGKYLPNTHDDDWQLCGNNDPSSQADSTANKDHGLWLFFILANLLIGLGSCALYTIGPEFLDDNVAQKDRLSMYMGIFYAASAIGPLFGYLGSAISLSAWVDLTAAPNGIERDDKEWVGAWWLPFVFIGALSFLNSAYLYHFPDKVREGSSARTNSLDVDETGIELTHQGIANDGTILSMSDTLNERGKESDKETSHLLSPVGEELDDRENKTAIMRDMYSQAKSVEEFLIGFLGAAGELFRNHAYVFSVCGQITTSMAVASASLHTPRIVESVFGLNSSTTSFAVGATIVPGAVLGILAGGFYSSKMKLDVKGIFKFQRIVSIVCLGLLFVLLLIPPLCASRRPQFAGLTRSVETNSSIDAGSKFIGACNANCGCDEKAVEPVCGSDGITYLSPCLAGCSLDEPDSKNTSVVFQSCECINDEKKSATVGQCTFVCKWIYLYLFFLFILLFSVTSQTGPQTEALLRVVRPRLRAFGLAWGSIAFRLFGTIPGPILVGLFIDSTCIKWSNSESGNAHEKGDCLLYDNSRLSLAYLPITIPCMILSATFATLALRVYKKRETSNSLSRESQSFP